MIGNSLDLPGSREHIARLVREYEAALEDGDGSVIFEKRERMGRWLWLLARWYLDHAEEVPQRRILLDENDLKKIFPGNTDAETWREKLRRAMMGY